MFRILLVGFFLAVAYLLPSPALAVQPDEILKDPALEKRARVISRDLRCLVCQNQSIDDSDAPLAKDLRVLVRERLEKGETNTQVIDFVVSRYGEFVLLKPRFALHTLILWLAAPFILFIGVYVMFRSYRRRAAEAKESGSKRLSAKEKRDLSKLLKET